MELSDNTKILTFIFLLLSFIFLLLAVGWHFAFNLRLTYNLSSFHFYLLSFPPVPFPLFFRILFCFRNSKRNFVTLNAIKPNSLMMKGNIFKSICLFALLLTAVLAGSHVVGQNTDSFTQTDRERMIRLEAKFESLQKQQELTNSRIDDFKSDVNLRFGELQTFMYWGFGILFSMMMVLMGFVLWDRRTAISPIELRTRRMEEALIEYAKTDPKFKEILKKAVIY